MEVIELEVLDRAGIGSGDARRLRASGRVPAVVYRKGQDSKSVTLDTHSFSLMARGKPHSQIFKFNGSKDIAGLLGLVKSVQMEPIKGTLEHIEFLAVTEDQNVTVNIPIAITGTPECVRLGAATISQMSYEITIECLPTKIPTTFNLDISGLEAGASLHASDLSLPEGVVLKSVQGLTIVTAFVEKRAAEAAATPTPAGKK